jgi:plastocyanin
VKTALKVFILTVAVLFIGLPRVHSDTAEPVEPEVVIVKIEELLFVPEEVKVKAGTTIRWMNEDPVPHDVTSGTSITGREARGKKKVKFHDGKFQSDLFPQGKTFEVTLTEKGDYPYYCNVHPFMVGKIMLE